MKVTEFEIRSEMVALVDKDGSNPYDVLVGTEEDGDLVVVLVAKIAELELRISFSRAVMKLAKRHNERYTPYIMGKAMFARYEVYNGFVEAVKEDVAKERWRYTRDSRRQCDVIAYGLDDDQDYKVLMLRVGATNEQMFVAAAAPELLNAVEQYEVMLQMDLPIPGEFRDRVQEIIKKVRGK